MNDFSDNINLDRLAQHQRITDPQVLEARRQVVYRHVKALDKRRRNRKAEKNRHWERALQRRRNYNQSVNEVFWWCFPLLVLIYILYRKS